MFDSVLTAIIAVSALALAVSATVIVSCILKYRREARQARKRYISRIPDEYLEYRGFPQPEREWTIKAPTNHKPKV